MTLQTTKQTGWLMESESELETDGDGWRWTEMDERTDRRAFGRTDGRSGVRAVGRAGARARGRTDGRTDGHSDGDGLSRCVDQNQQGVCHRFDDAVDCETHVFVALRISFIGMHKHK